MNLHIHAIDENGLALVDLTIYQDGSDSEAAQAIHNFITQQFQTDQMAQVPEMSVDWLASSLQRATFLSLKGTMSRITGVDPEQMELDSEDVCVYLTTDEFPNNPLQYCFKELYDMLQNGNLQLHTLAPIVAP